MLDHLHNLRPEDERSAHGGLDSRNIAIYPKPTKVGIKKNWTITQPGIMRPIADKSRLYSLIAKDIRDLKQLIIILKSYNQNINLMIVREYLNTLDIHYRSGVSGELDRERNELRAILYES